MVGGVLAAALAATIAAPAGFGTHDGRVRYDGHKVVRAYPEDANQHATLLELSADVWSESRAAVPLVFRIEPVAMAALDASGIDYDTLIEDVQVPVDAELARREAGDTQDLGDWFTEYKDFTAVYGYLNGLVALRPDLAEVVDVGSSLEGRAIRGIRISGSDEPRPAVLYTSVLHAREWIASMVTMCLADTLVRDYDTDPQVKALVDDVEIIIVPLVNPDGYVYSWDVERFWRKNRRDGHGVDLNRNFSVDWGNLMGSSNEVDAEDYHGEAAFSEPESATLRDFIEARPQLVAHIDYHAYGQLVLYPWGYTFEPAPDDALLVSLAENLAAAIDGVHGEEYLAIQGAELYPASGTLDDWSYGERGIMALTVELRPPGWVDPFEGFMLPPEQIVPTCEENIPGALSLAAWAATQVPGEDTGDSGPSPDFGGADDADDGSASGPPGMDESTTEPGDDTADGSTSGTGGGGGSDIADRGCACAANGRRAPLALLVFALVGVRRKR